MQEKPQSSVISRLSGYFYSGGVKSKDYPIKRVLA